MRMQANKKFAFASQSAFEHWSILSMAMAM
jgi:hypothetical protein